MIYGCGLGLIRIWDTTGIELRGIENLNCSYKIEALEWMLADGRIESVMKIEGTYSFKAKINGQKLTNEQKTDLK